MWVRYRQLFPWFFGDPGTMGRVVFLVFLGLSITAFAGLLLRRRWGFFAFYAAVVFATIMLALSFIPIPLTFLPARHRWIGMTLLNLIALLAGVFIQRRMRMTGARTE